VIHQQDILVVMYNVQNENLVNKDICFFFSPCGFIDWHTLLYILFWEFFVAPLIRGVLEIVCCNKGMELPDAIRVFEGVSILIFEKTLCVYAPSHFNLVLVCWEL
jgi:hypothetical protein